MLQVYTCVHMLLSCFQELIAFPLMFISCLQRTSEHRGCLGVVLSCVGLGWGGGGLQKMFPYFVGVYYYFLLFRDHEIYKSWIMCKIFGLLECLYIILSASIENTHIHDSMNLPCPCNKKYLPQVCNSNTIIVSSVCGFTVRLR